MKKLTTFLALSTLSGLAQAHGSHDVAFSNAVQHLFSSPEHVWPLLPAGFLLAFMLRRPLARLLGKSRKR